MRLDVRKPPINSRIVKLLNSIPACESIENPMVQTCYEKTRNSKPKSSNGMETIWKKTKETMDVDVEIQHLMKLVNILMSMVSKSQLDQILIQTVQVSKQSYVSGTQSSVLRSSNQLKLQLFMPMYSLTSCS